MNDTGLGSQARGLAGNFSRSFTLPRTIDPEKISASYRDGVLQIEVPKKEEAKPKQIRIAVNS